VSSVPAQCSRTDGRMAEHPESFPVNTLVPIEGTPLENNEVSRADSCVEEALTTARPGPHGPSNHRYRPYCPPQNYHPSRRWPTHLL